MFAMTKPLNVADRFIFNLDLTKSRNWRESAANLSEWEAWDRIERERRGFFAGLKFWRKTNVPGSRVLLSRHWPHRLCWDWSVWIGLHRGKEYDGSLGVRINISRRYRVVNIDVLWLKFHVHWQGSQYMAALGPFSAEAPKIVWMHHLARADGSNDA